MAGTTTHVKRKLKDYNGVAPLSMPRDCATCFHNISLVYCPSTPESPQSRVFVGEEVGHDVALRVQLNSNGQRADGFGQLTD